MQSSTEGSSNTQKQIDGGFLLWLEEGVAKTVAQIEELKTDIKSMRESLKPQRAEIKQVEKEIAKLEAKKAKAEQKAAEEAKKSEAEAVVKKLLAGGMSADEILEKLK